MNNLQIKNKIKFEKTNRKDKEMKAILREIKKEEFKEIYEIMEASFPPEERRTYEEEKKQFVKSKYKILVVEDEIGIQGFIKEWDLKACYFIEHFAIKSQNRGKGLGSRVMKEYLKGKSKAIILEVEGQGKEIAKRRIAFYKRLGFTLSDIEYIQPNLQKTNKDILLKLMYYPKEITREDLIKGQEEIFTKVYEKIFTIK